MRSYQARLRVGANATQLLDRYGEVFGRALRTMHARRCAGDRVSKTEFMQQFGLTSRQFNAVEVTSRGLQRSVLARQSEAIKELRGRVEAAARRLAKGKNSFVGHQLKRALQRLNGQVNRLVIDRDAGVVRICFGSRRLFRAQHHLAVNGFRSSGAWRAAWQTARSGQFFVIGCRSETAGCQGCTLTHLGNDRFNLRLWLPTAASERYMNFEVAFAYGWEHLAWALDHQAISYRFLRDEKGWRVFATTAAPPIAVFSDLRSGAMGVDLNADHVALARTNGHGNVIASQRLDLVTYGATQEQRKAKIGNVVRSIVAQALRCGVPIVVERLDFAKKKATLKEHGRRYARMLSSFAYKQLLRILRARAHDAGIAVIMVNPTYSSIIGKHKFARRYGLSTHQSAALVLARRAFRFSERPNRHDQVALDAPARMRSRHIWSYWRQVARGAAGDGPRGRPLRPIGRGDPRVPVGWNNDAQSEITPPAAGELPARESVVRTVRTASLALRKRC